MSTTLPAGTGGAQAPQWMMGSAHHHDHEHAADGSCCGHDHSHEHAEQSEQAVSSKAHFQVPDDDEDDEECYADRTNPSGGCACC